MKILKRRININSKDYQVEAPEDISLLWLIRDHIGLTGTKFGCGKGLCGACTIHIEGRANRSCLYKLKDLKDEQITTIEGISEKDQHPVQVVWNKFQVAQCGYCQSGQIMTAIDLLKRFSKPTKDTIRKEMKGNLCRCGTYPRIEKAIEALLKEDRS